MSSTSSSRSSPERQPARGAAIKIRHANKACARVIAPGFFTSVMNYRAAIVWKNDAVSKRVGSLVMPQAMDESGAGSRIRTYEALRTGT